MADFLRSWIVNITVIIIFIMFLDTIMPNDSMKRYINVIIGLLIIIAVIKPFILVKDYVESFDNKLMETASYVEKSGGIGNSEKINRFHKQKAVEIFENNLKKQIMRIVKSNTRSEYREISIELELERNFEREDFGNIKSVTVNMAYDSSKVAEVDRIRINVNEGMEENKNVINEDKAEYNLNDSRIKNEIKDEIGKALGISKSVISVNVQKK